MNLVEKEIEELKFYENNPRNNDDAVEVVKKSIEKFGFKVPLVIDKNNVIVCGHTRAKACIELGIKKVPCVIADDLTDEQIKAFRLADNKVAEASTWDYNLLDFELDAIKGINMEDFGFLGEINLKMLDDLVDNQDFVNKKDLDVFQLTFIFNNESKEAIMGYIKENGKEKLTAEIEKICKSN